MRFLNGFKTIIGGVGLLVGVLSKADVVVLLPGPWQPYVIGASAVMAALGIVHKVEKATLPPAPGGPTR